MRLFAARSYHDVTVEEIATAAGVSHMTFFRHFPTKVSVLVDDPYDPIIGEMVARTDPSLPSLERVRRGLLTAWASVDEPDDEIIRARLRILTANDDIVAHAWANNQQTSEVIIEALVSTGVPMLEARVTAGAVIGALTAALLDWAEHQDTGTLGDRVRRALQILESAQGIETK